MGDLSAARLRKSEDATATVINMLEENMRHLEDMEEEKIRMQQEHEDEKQRLEEQMEQIVDQWLEQKARLEESMAEEKQQMRRDMEEFRGQCEEEIAQEKAQMAVQAEGWRKERERLAKEKAEMTRQVDQCHEELMAETERMAGEKVEMMRKMDAFRAECGQKMAEERVQMSRKTADFEAECERSMQEKEREMGKKMADLRSDFERRMQEEKQELTRKTEEFRRERQRLAQEKEEMVRQMDEFTQECERTMGQEKEEMSRQTAEYQAECERRMRAKEEELAATLAATKSECEAMMREEKKEMLAKQAEFHAECERLEREKVEMTRNMDEFRAQSEERMEQEKKLFQQEMQEFLAECERLEQEKRDMTQNMAEFRLQCEQRMEQEKLDMGGEMAEFRFTCESKIKDNEAEMSNKMAEWRAEKERLEQETRDTTRRLELEKQECEKRFAEERQHMSKKTAEFVAECERKMDEKETEMAMKMGELANECEALAQEKADTMQTMAAFREECERLELDKRHMTEKMASSKAELQEKELEMARKTGEFLTECERLESEKQEMTQKMVAFRAECELNMAKEKAQLTQEMAEFRAECERLAEEKADMTRNMMQFRTECEQKMEEKEREMVRKAGEFRAEQERLEADKVELTNNMNDFRSDCDKKMAAEKEEMARQTSEFFAECQQKMEENEREMNKKSLEFNAEYQRLVEEKQAMTQQMHDFRAQCERKMAEEEEELLRMTTEFRAESERKVLEEQAASERRLAETRRQTEEQLRTERQITDHIMNVLRELPPLQAAMELGDLGLLEQELGKWKGEILPERFGEGKGVVEAVVKLAKERLVTWRGVEHTWKDVLRQVERLPGGVPALTQQCQRLFRALKEAQLTKMDLRRSDPQAIERICEVFDVWQERSMCQANGVQRAIIRKVVNWSQLGPFDFADMDICLRLVDRGGPGSDVFLARAKALVEDQATAPKEFRGLLAHVETMLFFLKYAGSEDLALTHAEFRKQAGELDAAVAGYLAWTERRYPPGAELVTLPEGRGLFDGKDVAAVLEEIRRPARGAAKDGLIAFREIFFQWALAMKSRFDLLVLPHHTQVICLLAFQRFLEAEKTNQTPHSLIAQVGTGEGKSMIVAALAIYVVVVLGKKAHVVVDDETLLERDFWTFKRLFDAFQVPERAKGRGAGGEGRRPLAAVLCATEERVASSGGEPSIRARVDPDADICYCEAKHVQSFYASIARSEQRDFDSYDERVLILDEVDALVIDEEPNEAFVYPNAELGRMATAAAEGLARGLQAKEAVAARGAQHPASGRVASEMTKEWQRGKQLADGEDFVYSKELGRYCALHAGRANPKAWSLALECRNFQDGLSREILFQERLFVMSRPRVFRRYHRILGLSGSIGSKPERAFLRETYRAAFFEVPPFLKTCRGSPFHEPVPAKLGEKKRAVYVEASLEAQIQRIAEVALEARERVPVLVISRDRLHADQLVDGLRQAARSRGLGSTSEDVVRSLSRTLYEADSEQWKENLNRATLPLGEHATGSRSWRVTVTDPRGGRGTDYRVDDAGVDEEGGLLLIPTLVPTSQREWTQFLGRTARQDRRGQFCAVLCNSDYEALSKRYSEPLPSDRGGIETIRMVLSWGDRQVADKIRGSAALYNCGVRMNELCEEVFGKRSDILKDPVARERLVDACQRLRWMSVREINEAFARLPGMDPARIFTEARDLGRPAEPPAAGSRLAQAGGGVPGYRSPGMPAPQEMLGSPDVPKVVIFCLDWSCSMLSRDTRTPLNRFETCVKCVQRILQDQVRDDDVVGVVCFGPKVETVVALTPKAAGGRQLQNRIQTLRPQTAGGTCFFDAVAQCLQMMHRPGQAMAEANKWLVCLTDGDDLGSRRENTRGELVNQMLEAGVPSRLNMVMITVGTLRAGNMQIIDGWADQVSRSGGLGKHVSEKDAAAISKAFEVVAECLATEVGGATEC